MDFNILPIELQNIILTFNNDIVNIRLINKKLLNINQSEFYQRAVKIIPEDISFLLIFHLKNRFLFQKLTNNNKFIMNDMIYYCGTINIITYVVLLVNTNSCNVIYKLIIAII